MLKMQRIAVAAGLAGLLVSGVGATASAQEWAEKMFTEKTHDFGSVAKAAKVEYAFEMVNPYKEDIHISSVRAELRLHDSADSEGHAEVVGKRGRRRRVQYPGL